MMKTREKALVAAVEAAKKSQFGLTAIKVEFEIVFNRSRAMHNPCDVCDGDGMEECEDCEARGLEDCPDCGGDIIGTCGTCRAGFVFCQTCNGECQVPCSSCAGRPASNWNDFRFMHDKVLAKLVRAGLAQKIPNGMHYQNARKYMPKAPLVYSEVLHDSTVDTEQTLTLLMDNPQNVLLLPKLVRAFYSLKDEIGQVPSIDGAGLHISLLNSQDGGYPAESTAIDRKCFENFRRSMILLLPALYFLGSSNERSRDMTYRKPMIERGGSYTNHGNGKYSAISYRNGALEFRVFEPCFDKPEAILDDVMVALNCMRFWTRKYTRNYLAKITKEVDFGNDRSSELRRLYITYEHLDLLNRGLRMIKPCYYSVTELKKQRNFTVTKIDIRENMEKARKLAEEQYKRYEAMVGWEQVMERNNYINRMVSEHLHHTEVTIPDEKKMKEFEKKADKIVKNTIKKDDLDTYCSREVKRIIKPGDYKLCAV